MKTVAEVPRLEPSYTLVWVAYAREPANSPPKRWTGLVGYGRLDILVRVVLAALYPGGVRDPHSLLIAFLDSTKPRAIVLTGDCLPQRAVYESDIGAYILEALRGERCKSYIVSGGLRELIAWLKSQGYRVVVLHESGRPFTGYQPYTAYILGLRDDPPLGVGEDAVESLGARSYLASHVTAFIRLASSIPLGLQRTTQAGDEG
ncbi:hypothetical protein [Hyperthermus butylicus]|uniref:Uncharacterized protein n=1 Tax=Hyperthermus butylicus (strain DSM 5456 / JCM 9403 / PLM1-5) TaxID=415426 RepID=A2BKW9_HYPBU|nr:hypothetical protein [Hyperthermus butylicus]ABM80630.1 hypothetical protein Hbut_0777 [Hyperthermus butylicus DSM 5456]